jgi:hypothetical protein
MNLSKIKIVSFLFILFLSFCLPQAKAEESIAVRSFDQTKVEQQKTQKEYDYNLKQKGYAPTIWQRIWMKIVEFLSFIFSSKKEITIIRMVVVATIILIAILLLYRMNKTNTFSGRANTSSTEIPVFENLNEVNFDAIIAKAEGNQNYAEAIRYYFIKYLYQLDCSKQIRYDKNKTNFDYLYEIKESEPKRIFRSLMLVQESVVYGHKEASLAMLEDVKTAVNSPINSASVE